MRGTVVLRSSDNRGGISLSDGMPVRPYSQYLGYIRSQNYRVRFYYVRNMNVDQADRPVMCECLCYSHIPYGSTQVESPRSTRAVIHAIRI